MKDVNIFRKLNFLPLSWVDRMAASGVVIFFLWSASRVGQGREFGGSGHRISTQDISDWLWNGGDHSNQWRI